MADDKQEEMQDQAVVDQEAAATDSDQAQSASDAAVSKANEAIKQATAAVQAAGASAAANQADETASAVSAATAAASAAKAASEAAEAASAVAAEVTEGAPPTVIDKHKRKLNKIRLILEYIRQAVLIIVSLFLLYFLTEDILRHGIPLDVTEKFLEIQFWICIFFLVDIIFGVIINKDRRRFILDNWLFFVVSIPYLPLLIWSDVKLGPELLFVLKLVPMARGAFAIAIVLGWLIYDKASTLFVTYLTVLLTLIYLSSVAFYTSEHGVNPLVHDYSDALWWACMDVTTVGCNIEAVTLTGKILSVVLACAGMMMLPLFTVYITSLLAKKPDFNF